MGLHTGGRVALAQLYSAVQSVHVCTVQYTCEIGFVLAEKVGHREEGWFKCQIRSTTGRCCAQMLCIEALVCMGGPFLS